MKTLEQIAQEAANKYTGDPQLVEAILTALRAHKAESDAEIARLRELLESVTNDSAERLALDMDHRSKDHSQWWAAVETARDFLKGGDAPCPEGAK